MVEDEGRNLTAVQEVMYIWRTKLKFEKCQLPVKHRGLLLLEAVAHLPVCCYSLFPGSVSLFMLFSKLLLEILLSVLTTVMTVLV